MKANCKDCIHKDVCHIHECYNSCEEEVLENGCENFFPAVQNTIGEDRIISQDFLEGMKVVGKALAKECKRQHTYIKELKSKAHYSWDFEDVHEEEEKLSHCVEMKVLAEKLYKKYRHLKEEQNQTT